MNTIFLYSTLGCHLCDDAKNLLSKSAFFESLVINEVEIAESERLVELYGVRIPVLKHEKGGEELGWPFDLEQLDEWLSVVLYQPKD